MSEILANDLKAQYKKAFNTIRRIAETFPEDRWREPHGDVYYIPCRIAYHLAVVIDNYIAGGFRDKDFSAKLPYGKWIDAKAENLPDRTEFLAYFDSVLDRAEKVLSNLNDDDLMSALEPERTRMGASQMGMHLYMMRELSDHTGELNKMLIEDGGQDVWISR
ncbi:MAG: DinB family protein [Negativicutes bacterium]|nr:DinB family protein [Negativicutes bacterium]